MKPTSCNDDGDHVSHALQRPQPLRHQAGTDGWAGWFRSRWSDGEERGERDKTAGKRTAAPTNERPSLPPSIRAKRLLGWSAASLASSSCLPTFQQHHQCLRPSIKSWHHHYLTGFLRRRRRRRRSVCASIARIHFPMREGATDVGCLVDDAPSGSPLLSAA